MTNHTTHAGSTFETKIKTGSPRFERNQKAVAELVTQARNDQDIIRQGGGDKAIESQHKKGRLTSHGACMRSGGARRPRAS
jgi:3-methylcrotonyl-CoA carboxylase beta subunit